MIVRLERATSGDGAWLLSTEGGPVDAILPTRDLALLMEGERGYFHAEQTHDGWDILRRAPEQRW
jgi:hypothetical protein